MRAIKIIGRILSSVLLVLLTVLLCTNIYMIVRRQVFHDTQPEVFGYSTAVVLSGSMEPIIHVDDMVVIHREENYQVQDIIMYDSGTSLVTHRIMEQTDEGFITRGDANNANDPVVPAEKVVGKVVYVLPGVGKIIGFMQTPLGMCSLVLIALAVFWLPGLFGKQESGKGHLDR